MSVFQRIALAAIGLFLIFGGEGGGVLPLPDKTEPWVLIVEEKDERTRLPELQQQIWASVPLRRWLDEKGVEYRFWDDDVDNQEGEPWASALAMSRERLPWVHASNGATTISQALPGSVDELKVVLSEVAE